MSERTDDVRATSDAVLADTERLHALEVEKRGLDPTSQRFLDLSLEIEDLGTRLAIETTIERDLGERSEPPTR